MNRGIRFSAVVLSAVMIASCATNRIQGVRLDDLACKTPESKYDYGRNLPIQAIKSNNRKYTRYVYRSSWNNNHNRYVSKNTTIPYKNPGEIDPDQKISEDHNMAAFYDIDRQTIDRQLIIWSATEVNKDQLDKLRGPGMAFHESAEMIITPSPEEYPTPAINSFSPSNVSGKEYVEGSLPNVYPGQADVSVRTPENPEQSQKKPFGNSEAFIFMMALMAGLIPFSVMRANLNLATNISFWAAMNPWKTRIMFAATNTAMIAGGLMLGDNLADNGIHFSGLSRYLLMGTFFASSLLYPSRNTTNSILKHSYSKQKAFDLAVAISGFMLMVNAGNDPEVRATMTTWAGLNNRDYQYENTVQGIGQQRQNLMYYETAEQVQDEQKTAEEEKLIRRKKTGGTVLVSIAALVAAVLVMVLACNLSCNGYAGLAALTGIGGGALVIGLTIWAIRRIWRPKSGRKIKPPDVTEPVLAKGNYRV